MNIINNLLLKNEQFELKIDSYFYDSKADKVVLTIRLCNKRYIQKIFLTDIVNDMVILNNLHPVDICLIGVLYTHLGEITKSSHPIKAPEFIELLKITPCLKILEISYNENNEEEFIISPLFHDKKLKVTADDIYKKIDVLNGMSSKDALQIGCALKNIPINTLNINNKLIFIYGIYFILLVTSSFLLNTSIDFITNLGISSKIIFLLILLVLQGLILRNKSKYLIFFIFIPQIFTWLFYLYYYFITSLPLKLDDRKSYVFDNLFYNNINEVIFYSIALMLISVLHIYIFKKVEKYFKPRLFKQVWAKISK